MTTDQRRAFLALALLLPAPSLGTAAALWWFPDSALGQGIFFACKLWIVALPLLWYRFSDHGRWSFSPMRHGGWIVGILTGLAIAAAIILAYLLAAPHLDIAAMAARLQAIGLGHPGRFLVMAVYWITINAVIEEFVWRWFVVSRCARLWSTSGAIVASALAFTLHHAIALAAYLPPGLTLLATLGVGIGGLIWSALYLRYRSIWPGYISHAIVDIAIFAIAWSWLRELAPGS